MKRTLTLVLLGCLMSAVPAPAQSVELRDELLQDWLGMKNTMLRLADEMPDETFDFRPTDAQRTFVQQVLHVAGANLLNLNFLGGEAPAPPIDRTAMECVDVMAAIDASFDYGAVLLETQNDEWLMEVVETNAFLGVSSRARVVWFLLGHSWDIYGQMVVYLRLNGQPHRLASGRSTGPELLR